MVNNAHDSPPNDVTLDGESLTSSSPAAQNDKTEPLQDSQAGSIPESLTQALSSQALSSQAPFSPSPSQLHETLLPAEAGPSTQTPARAQTGVSPSSLDQTLAPSIESPTSAPTRHAEEMKPHGVPLPPSGPESEFPPIAGYTVVKELGRGGMGVVYKAKQPGLNRLVALKMLLTGKGSKKERDQFRLEAEVIAKLQHPNIVQIYEIGEHHESLYFALEFVEAGCLSDVLAKQRPTPRQAAHIVQMLAEGMDLAHSQGIIHRDLKPANVLLGGKPGAPLEELVPKITDFGLAKLIEEGDSTKHHHSGIMGTPSYMPPEQAEGRNHQVGPPADIYSLGAVLYDLLAGKPPFRGTTLADTLHMVCNTPPRPPAEFNPAIPHDLQIICLKCLEKEPEKRYRSARELAADLEAFLNGDPISARSYSKWELTRKWVRRRPAAAGLLLVSVFALLSVAVGGVFIARQQSALATAEESRRKDAEEHAAKEKSLRESEEREKERAESNLREAASAVGVLTELGHRRLSSVPHVEGIRRELLEKALAYNEHFLAINGDRPSQRQEVARSLLRAAEIQEMLGKQQQAEQSYQKALTTFTALVKDEPASEDHRRDLAKTWNDLAILQAAGNQETTAEKSYAEAIALKTALVKEAGSNSDYKRDLANSLMSRGAMWMTLKKTKEAETDYQAALGLLAALPRKQCQEDLAKVHSSLGALWITDQPAKAAAANEKAIEGWRALVKQSSEPRFRHELATVYSNRGVQAYLQSKPKEAEADYEEATRLLAKLTSEYRGVVAYRELLANVYHYHGQLLRNQGRHLDSAKIWRVALPLWSRLAEDFPNRVDYRQKLGQTSNELGIALASTNRLKDVEGLWEEAIAIQEKLVAEKPGDAEYWQDLVDSCVNVSTLLQALPRTERTEKAVRRVIEVQQRRGKAFPGVPGYESSWASSHAILAEFLVKQNRPEDACRELAAAVKHMRIALAAAPAVPAHEQGLRDYSLTLIELHLQKDRYTEARLILSELLVTSPADRSKASCLAPERAAQLMVRCLSAAQKDKRLAEPERSKAVTACGDAAMELLRRAAAQGFKDGKALKTETWQALHGREDFQTFLKRLNSKE